jgi:hypothetical protein
MYQTVPKHSFLLGLVLMFLTSSCLSNLGTKFGKHTFTVSSNLPNYAVRINGGSPYPFIEKTGPITFIGSGSQQIFCFKNGFQEEQVTIIPNRQNGLRYFDIGAGIIYIASSFSFLGPGSTPTEAIVGGAGLLVYGFSHLLNASVPAGTFGVYAKYKNTTLPFVLYPDSATNPKKILVGCNSFMLNTQKSKVIGSLTEFGKYKGLIRYTDSLLIDSIRMVENVNQHLVKLKLANKWTKFKKLKNADASFAEEPNLILNANVIELTQNGLQAFDKTELVYEASIGIEWTITNKEGNVLLKKTTKGVGSRKEEMYSNFNRAQEITAMDDAVRRALNELLFSAKFIETIHQ